MNSTNYGKPQVTYSVTIRDKQGGIFEYHKVHKTDADKLYEMLMGSYEYRTIHIRGTIYFTENLASVQILEATATAAGFNIFGD